MSGSISISTPSERVPDITWHQRKERVCINLSMSLASPDSGFTYNLSLSGDQLELTSDIYNFNTTLYQPVKLITHSYNGRIIEIIIEKTPTDDGEYTFWETLSCDRTFNKSHVRVNWNNWLDEDDSKYTGVPEMGDMPWGDYGGGGDGGGDFEDYMQGGCDHPGGAECGVECGAECGVECGAECGVECGAECGVECGAECGVECGAEGGVVDESTDPLMKPKCVDGK